MNKFLSMVAIASIASLSLMSCGSSTANPTKGVKTTTTQVETTTPVETKSSQKTWVMDSSVNDMGEVSRYVSLEANDKVDLNFPYHGGSTGSLVVRKKNGKLSVMFIIDKGQIDTDYDGTIIRVKFDDEAPQKWTMNQSADGSSDVLFFESKSKFLEKLKKSKKLVLEIPFFQNPPKQFTFNTEGLVL